MSDLVGNTKCWFSHEQAQVILNQCFIRSIYNDKAHSPFPLTTLLCTSHLHPWLPRDRGIAGLLTFQFALPGKICGKTPAESPGSPGADYNVEQQLGVVLRLMKLKHVRRASIQACECLGVFGN